MSKTIYPAWMRQPGEERPRASWVPGWVYSQGGKRTARAVADHLRRLYGETVFPEPEALAEEIDQVLPKEAGLRLTPSEARLAESAVKVVIARVGPISGLAKAELEKLLAKFEEVTVE